MSSRTGTSLRLQAENNMESEKIETAVPEQAIVEEVKSEEIEIDKKHDLEITEENQEKSEFETKTEDGATRNSSKEIMEDLDTKVPQKEKNRKDSPRLKKTRREEIPDIFEEKKVEKSFGVKEFFAVVFTILFALVNVYLWMLINSKDK